MTTTTTSNAYTELLAKRDQIDKELKQMLALESSTAISTCRDLIERFNLTPDMLFSSVKAKTKTANAKPEDQENGVPVAKKIVPMKFKDPVTGSLWSGRGKTPLWIKEKDRDQFLIRS